MKAKIFLTGLALVAITAFASGQNPVSGNGNGRCTGTAKCSNYTDVNKNGICDTYEAGNGKGKGTGKGTGIGQREGKGTGTCTGTGNGTGQGKGFVDADQDGVCDTNKNCKRK